MRAPVTRGMLALDDPEPLRPRVDRLGVVLFLGTAYFAATNTAPFILPLLKKLAPGASNAQLHAAMHILTIEGRRLAGADAYVELARARAWSRPLAWFAALPVVLPILRRVYHWIAAHRPCDAGACRVPPTQRGGRPRWG